MLAVAGAFTLGFSPAMHASPVAMRARMNNAVMSFDQEAFIAESKEMRLTHLEEQAMFALKTSVENFENPVFPNAMIAGDCVITHLLGRLGYLESGKVTVMCVDTFHLFPETMELLKEIESFYNMKAVVFQPADCETKAVYDSKHGADLWKENIEEYDRICKVEPFGRGLKETKCDCMINGRTRWQGFERAYIDLYEASAAVGGMAKVNPLAYWSFEDTFDYIAKYKIPHHPLHAQGYPSLGDAKDTIPIPEDGSTKFVNFKFDGDKTAWLDYASERKGRFVGLSNKDGSKKTECGIHVAGAEKTWDRDLWDADSKVTTYENEDAVMAAVNSEEKSLMVVYAPWCQFCQAMEEEFEKVAAELDGKVTIAKFRGDEVRDFVGKELNTTSFPTINVVGGGKAVKYESEERDAASLKALVEKAMA
jgi:phosphoadenosine phosphosulfate reductase